MNPNLLLLLIPIDNASAQAELQAQESDPGDGTIIAKLTELAGRLQRRRPRPGDTWHLDEVFIRIPGVQHYLCAPSISMVSS
jgi:hypothetical protein